MVGSASIVMLPVTAVEDIYRTHKYNDVSPQQGISYALQATCDVESSLDHGSDSTGSPYTLYLQDTLDEDLLSMDNIDAALNRTLFLRFQLGLFDPDDEDTNQFWNSPGGYRATKARRNG